MHFVIAPTDPSIAHVNLDLQEMEKTAQVVFSVVCLFSYGSRNFRSSLYLSLPVTTCFFNSNATTGVDPGEVDWEASHRPFFSRLTCLLKRFNWHFIPVLCVICVPPGRERVFKVVM